MAANSILDDIPAYSVLKFPQAKPALIIKGCERWKSATYSPSWKFQVRFNLFVNLNRYSYYRRSVEGQLTGC